MEIAIRELGTDEFHIVDRLWEQYRGQETDRSIDRVFGGFADGDLVATTRVRQHPDGLEVDGVFTAETHRGAGLARRLVQRVVDELGDRTLWLHATIPLIGFYRSFGWVPVDERALPDTIRDRLAFCFGQMMGCGVAPMRRDPPSRAGAAGDQSTPR
ncbi:MAG: GNAT family N-acetyltransferase [Methanospirillum sp.]|nr:GNAT family N-acetyltransferase [Methanospirillum sp.]